MTLTVAQRETLDRLLSALRDDELTGSRAAELEQLVLGHAEAMRHYLRVVNLGAGLRWMTEEEGGGLGTSVPGNVNDGEWPVDSNTPVGAAIEPPRQSDSEIPGSEPLVPPIVLDLPPTSHYPLATSHFFVGGPVFSYMVATVILCVMLLGAWAYKITHYYQIAEVPTTVPSIERPELVFVGRITGMKDCRWADPQTEAYAGAYVPLDRKYALASGLMEITYKTGAKVILQGPCTYAVESRHGGFLTLGKLTARVETDKETRRQGDKEKMAGDISTRFLSHCLLVSPSFSVRTPTAIVTDLGTEFGVEVSEEGNTTSHVFRGSVKVQVVGESLSSPTGRGAGDEGRVVQLGAGESARVEKNDDAGRPRLVLGSEVGAPPKFVRRLYEPPKLIDLLDIVAGGNGTGNRRERGINPTNGVLDPVFVTGTRGGDRFYWPVVWSRFIDGVFVPDGRAGKVQLDSAGHVFDGFPPTHGMASFSIWARAAEVKPEDRAKDLAHWVNLIIGDEKFMPDGRGLLCICSDAGVTFDLESVRRAYPGVVPGRFRAVAGMAERPPPPSGSNDHFAADLWVLVDGRLMLKRERLHFRDGTIDVDVELAPSDRFLTLAITDGGDRNRAGDTMVFGDPVLMMTSTESEGK